MRSVHRTLAPLLALSLLPIAACSSSSDPDSDTTDDATAAPGCPPATPSGTVAHDPTAILKYGSVPASSLDPIRMVEANEITVLQTIFDPLVKLDADDQPVPGLATGWSVVDDGVMEFTLRDGVVFSDGTPFDAEAVRFNIDRAMNDEESNIKGDLANVRAVEVVDELTVRFELDPPNPAAFPIVLSDRPGLMASPTAVRAAGSSTAFSDAPVGAGPYTVDGPWYARERVSVRAWDGYWNAQERLLGGIDFIETSTDASLGALQAGDLDVQYIEDDKVAAACADDRLRVISSSTNEIRALLINQAIEPFDDVRVRQALRYALDREAITEALTDGRSEAATQWFPEGSVPYSPELADAYPYDPQRARELLAEAGHPDGVTFTAEIGGTFTAYVRMGELVQAQLEQAGFTMDLQLIDPAQMLARLYGTADSPPQIAAAPLAMAPARSPSSRFRERFFEDGRYNPSGETIAGLRDLVVRADAAVDPDERADLLRQAAALVSEEAAAGVPLFFVAGHTAMGAHVGGVQRGSTRSNMIFDGLYITEGRVPVD
ncbi:ABC transporter substrate-binding protein [Solwaraspora sp. WMMA2056]|uniref:ABC transporter substrate-binding protein n=1 Tax=Solwaraspora sp. WMMA2056 TaxID=3015161 RepID=UPI00259BA05F|nr:ABC transporter substrate-binding protein [Solwaraspora sp. WMMA2056]WJK38553.1 ABC transporter substrate-binding protein [Solwaraspora sp. WMMA2056]